MPARRFYEPCLLRRVKAPDETLRLCLGQRAHRHATRRAEGLCKRRRAQRVAPRSRCDEAAHVGHELDKTLLDDAHAESAAANYRAARSEARCEAYKLELEELRAKLAAVEEANAALHAAAK